MNAQRPAPDSVQKIRAFISLNPPIQWQDALVNLQGQLKKIVLDSGIRWISPGSIHLTLRFLGAIHPDDITAISNRLRESTRTTSFELRPGSLGAFPAGRKPRVLWAGIEDASLAVRELHKAITETTADIGQPPEDRPFTPHLTLARVKDISTASGKLLQQSLSRTRFEPGTWKVTEACLMRSHLGQTGARYEVLERFPFVPV